VYELKLEHKHALDKLVVNVTRNNVVAGEIEASLPAEKTIAVNSFDSSDSPVDSPFFITVYRVRD
jgi:hypothetical protein